MTKLEIIARYGQKYYDDFLARSREKALRKYYEHPELRPTRAVAAERVRKFHATHPGKHGEYAKRCDGKRKLDPVRREARKKYERDLQRELRIKRKADGTYAEWYAKRAAYHNAWRERNREHVNAASREWHRAHPEVGRVNSVVRQMRVRLGGPVDKEFVAWLRQRPCIDCGSRERIEVGHIQSVVNGGSNDPANLIPQCRSCNRRLNSKDHRSINRG